MKTLISRVKKEPNGLQQLRLRMGLAKELINEAFPIGLLASTYFGSSEEVSIRLKIGNQSYDAIVSDSRSTGLPVEYVEVTLASDGEDDYLRMHVLHESGGVSDVGSVIKTGTRRTGQTIQVKREMVSQSEILRRESERVARAIARKLDKAYPPNTLLLVGFDDTMAFDRPDNIANLEATVATYFPQLKAFHSVVIVGVQQGLFLSWDTGGVI